MDLIPSEGQIPEATWGTYMLWGNGSTRRVRLGVSNDGFTRAEIELVNNNTSWGSIFFKTTNAAGGAVTRMVVHNNGNVGIGIGSNVPGSRLEVNGTIRAKEVKLESTNWPDYVFEEKYDLMPLDAVKSFINQKGHLPGLKSAKEYEQNGVNMLELNQKLLEKVEELTLYLIQKDAEISSMNTRLQYLELIFEQQ
ncbi:hypothetical protein ACFOUP_08665 [Belliella kenyensis]|uniref:Peptidase S74 domain-containing protein n=1 Tax=Belliella kenyensis TaxID=1472724 RepID=A0ABV8ELN0_9BACT|nr:hypothetical protein [Belliella kenyensis]MCH7403550.1 hypothetical protein [Belliella kenyensis]MDN3604928.1 hypothetical protein [Belliella kenyensis]